MIRRLLPLACLLVAACAPFTPRPGAETAADLARDFASRRAQVAQAQFLAQVTVPDAGRAGLPARFTAAFRHAPGGELQITGYSDLGQELFAFTLEGGRWRLATAAHAEAEEGRLDDPVIPPGVRLMARLPHLFDGLLGPDLAAPPTPAARGWWEGDDADGAVRFRLTRGTLTQVHLTGGGTPVRITFEDFRPVAGLSAPHRIRVGRSLGTALTLAVDEWSVQPRAAEAPATP